MTVNAWNSDNPVEATKGGTAQSSYAKGDILYASASNTLSKLAIGTDNHVLKVSSGAPAWAAASGGSTGAWVDLAQSTASSSASITFNSTYITSTYDIYVVVWHDLQGASDALLRLRFSPDNGSTVRTTGYDSESYQWTATGQNTASSSIELTPVNIGGATNEGGLIGIVYISNASDSGIKTAAYGHTGFIDGTAGQEMTEFTGVYDTAETHNYIEFTMSTGNISTGTAYLYGISTP